jgi:hypothetical protein
LSGQIGSNQPTSYVASTTYQTHGSMYQRVLAGGNLTLTQSHNARLQVESIQASNPNGTLLNLQYGYGTTNNNGNVVSQVVTRPGLGAWTQRYGYAEGPISLNRLTSATETGPGAWNQNYGYDLTGNRWVVDSPNSGLPGLTNETPKTKDWYVSGNQVSNRIMQQGWGYDNAGNITSVGGMTRSFAYL